MYEDWQSDSELWPMLLAAEPGDVVFVQGGHHVTFAGSSFDDLNGVFESTATGKRLWQPNPFPLPINLVRLRWMVWGGLIKYDDSGGIIDILFRLSVTVSWRHSDSEGFAEHVGDALILDASKAVSKGICTVLTRSPTACGAVTWIGVEAAAYGFAGIELVHHDEIYVAAGQLFIFRVTERESGWSGRSEAKRQNILYYGARRGLVARLYGPLFTQTCAWRNGWQCHD
jgi:hypothetical protein